MEINIIVPMNPVAWQRAGKRGKRHYTQAEHQKAMDDIRSFATAAMRGKAPIDGPVELSFRAIFSTLDEEFHGQWHITTPDLSNLLKLVEDAIKGFVITDDRRIARYGACEKVWGAIPGVEILVKEL